MRFGKIKNITQNIIGAVGNVAQVTSMRHAFMKEEVLEMLASVLKSK